MRETARLLPWIALALAIAASVVLLVLLVRHNRAISAELAAAASKSWAPVAPNTPKNNTPSTDKNKAETSAKPSASAKASPSRKTVTTAKPANRLLLATSAATAWRVRVGDCKTPGILERSTNGGKSWNIAGKAGLAPIVQLGFEQGNLYTVGGFGANCTARYVEYSSDGLITGQTDFPVGVWFLDPNDPDQINGPRNAKASPCGQQRLVGLAALDTSRAIVICSNGAMMATFDSGTSWKKVDEARGTVAVAAGGGRYWTASSAKDCSGVSLQWFAVRQGALAPGTRRCAAASKVTAGEVAIGVSSDAIWIWANKTVSVSRNQGRSWS